MHLFIVVSSDIGHFFSAIETALSFIRFLHIGSPHYCFVLSIICNMFFARPFMFYQKMKHVSLCFNSSHHHSSSVYLSRHTHYYYSNISFYKKVAISSLFVFASSLSLAAEALRKRFRLSFFRPIFSSTL